MVKEVKVLDNLRELGFEPVADSAILVKYAMPNLSAKVKDFFNLEYYVLQICKQELVLIPFGKMTGMLKKEVTLSLPLETIQKVNVSTEAFDYRITITTAEDVIALATQQTELADFRISSSYANDSFLGLGSKNWHKENLAGTLTKLTALGQ